MVFTWLDLALAICVGIDIMLILVNVAERRAGWAAFAAFALVMCAIAIAAHHT